jgi:hypothetical protein
MRTSGRSQSETEMPFLRPVMGKELSSVQFRSIEEQLYRAMAALHDQKQRHGVARLVGMRKPVTIVTPTVEKPPTTPKMIKSFLTRSYKKLSFALPSVEAHKAIADREKAMSANLLENADEPREIRRKVKNDPAIPIQDSLDKKVLLRKKPNPPVYDV